MMKKALTIGFYLLGGACAALRAQIIVQGYMDVHLCTPGEYEGVSIGFIEPGNPYSPLSGNDGGGFCFDDIMKLYLNYEPAAGIGSALFPEGFAGTAGDPPLYFSPPWFTAVIGTVDVIFNTTGLLNDNNDLGGGPPSPPCPGCCGASPDGNGSSGTDGNPSSSPNGSPPPEPGMPVWRVSEPYISLWLMDEPLGYRPSIGSRISLALQYNQREANTGMNPNIFSLGPKWNFSWSSYITLDQYGSNLVYFPGGGAVIFEGAYDYLTNTRLTGNMTNGFNVYYPDGSTDFYGCIVNNMAFLTQHLNPQSQSTTFRYQTNNAGVVQLQSVVDGSGGTNLVYYGATNLYSTNLITQVTDRYGRSCYFSYNSSNGCLTNITDVGGISSSLFYNSNFWVTNLQTPYGVTSFSLVDTPLTNLPPNGRSVLVTDPDGSSELFLAQDSAPGVAVSYTNLPSTSPFVGAITTNVSTYGVGSSTRLRTNIFTYSTNLIDLLTITNALNVQITSNAFNTNHQVLTNYDALNEKTVFTYDSNQRLTSMTTPTLLVVTNLYGADGYLAQQIDVGYQTNSYIYSNGLVYSHTDPRNMTFTNTWDLLQRLTSRTYPDGTYASNQYTILDRTATSDRLGNWTYFGYDQLRRNIAVTNALGNYALFDYCLCGALETYQDFLGHLTRYYYDNESRLTNTVYPDNYTVTNAYDLLGRLTNVIDGAGISISNWFNNEGLLIISSNAAGQVRNIAYDTLDRVTNLVDANGVVIGNSYDNLNRLLTRTYADGGVEAFGYSAFGLIAYTNQLTNRTYFAYDAMRRKTAETNALGNVTQYGYSRASDLISLTDQKNNTTQWGYDQFGRVTNKVDATGTTILKYQYDAGNRLTNRWSLAKSNTVYAYDAIGNLTNLSYAHAVAPTNQPLSFVYNAMNWMTSMSDAVGTTTFSYTPAGQLASENGPWSSDTVTYEYTDRLRTSLNLQQPNSSSWAQNYTYDLAGRMISVASPAGAFSYFYNPGLAGFASASSLVEDISLPNSAWITNAYDNNGRMLGTWLTNGAGSNFDSSVYTYNVGNQRTSVTRTDENTAAYTYDAMGEVIADQASEVSGGAARLNELLHYAYDAVGNLNYRTNNTLTEYFQVNTLNEFTQNTNGGKLTVMGTTTSAATNVTVNGTNAIRYGDATFAATSAPRGQGGRARRKPPSALTRQKGSSTERV